MNFSSLAGCMLKVRLGVLRAVPPAKDNKSGGFVYNALLNSSFKPIIERELPENTNIMFLMNGQQIVFEHAGFKEAVHAVALIPEPVIVKVILVGEEVLEQTLDAKYPSVKIGLQAIMNHSAIGGRPKISKSLVLAINTQDYSVNHIFIHADEAQQESIDMQIDYVNNLSEPLIKHESDECANCQFKSLCKNETLPVVACSTCAFYKINEPTCALGNNQGIRCNQHLYNPILLVNHKHKSVDVQNLFIEYDNFVNSNNPVPNKVVLTSDEMFTSHKFDTDRILDQNLHTFMKRFGAKIVN